MELTEHTRNVYLAERKALQSCDARPVSWTTAKTLAEDVVGVTVGMMRTSAPGILAAARWDNGRPWLLWSDPESINDMLLAHEVGHLVADRNGATGHGREWLTGYLSVLRSLGRRDEALVMRQSVGPVVVRQPLEDRERAKSLEGT